MSNHVLEINGSEFEDKVLGADKPTLVDFWAPWCAPCRALGPILEQLAEKRADEINVIKINVDDNPQIAGSFGVRSIPTVLLFNRGELKQTLIGVRPAATYEQILDDLSATA